MLHSLEKSKANFGRIESSVTKNLQVEDLHQPPTLSSIANTAAASASMRSTASRPPQDTYHSRGTTQQSEPRPPMNMDHENMQNYPSEDYLRFQTMGDGDAHSLQSQSIGNMNNNIHSHSASGINRQLGSSHSTILRRSAMSQQPQHYYSQHFDSPNMDQLHEDGEEDGDNNININNNFADDFSVSGRSMKSAQKMWSPVKSFRGGQRALVDDFSSTDGKNQAQNTWGLVTRVCINRGSLVKV